MLGNTKIARSVVELRAATGLRQAAFAKHLRVSLTGITHYEVGLRRPDARVAVRLAQAALAVRRHDLAETFLDTIPGVPQGLLVCGWHAGANRAPRQDFNYPRMMFHRTKPPVTVTCQGEEHALGSEWSRTVIQV